MNESAQEISIDTSEDLIRRTGELESFFTSLPINEFTLSFTRVINLWGEKRVGKTTFLNALRDSDFMTRKKIVWIAPVAETSIDTPQEFIAACSQGVRFPQNPDLEESISKRLEDSQKGKIDPIRSDDSILITRSSIAQNKKPYVNAAAAASVGRTSFIREDLEVSVGLGNNRAGNQAEAFLDALPLQSMGADLIVLHLPDEDALSGATRDWFRDYVIPAATKGPYRRNLIIVQESGEIFEFMPSNQSWGDWNSLVSDFELPPATVESVITFAMDRGCEPEEARFVYVKSLGYPMTVLREISALLDRADARARHRKALDEIRSLPTSDRERLAICSLPDVLIADELDALVGPGHGGDTLRWLASLPIPSPQSADSGDGFKIDDSVRFAAINTIEDNEVFRAAEKRWLPYARLIHNIPSRADRSRLLEISGLDWIDTDEGEMLFGDRSMEFNELIESEAGYFAKRKRYARISARLRSDLQETASHMENQSATSLANRAREMWATRSASLDEQVEDLEKSLTVVQERLQVLQSRYAQVAVLMKRFQKNGTPIPEEPDPKLVAGKSGVYGTLLIILTTASLIAGLAIASPLNLIAYLASFASLIGVLALVPSWIKQSAAKRSNKRAQIKDSPEYLQRENGDLVHRIQEGQTAYDDIKRDIAMAKEELRFNYA